MNTETNIVTSIPARQRFLQAFPELDESNPQSIANFCWDLCKGFAAEEYAAAFRKAHCIAGLINEAR